MTRLADKIEVREYIKEIVGEEYLIPLIGIYNSYKDIDFLKLPKSFVLKANHGSGWNIICHNKLNLDIRKTKIKLKKWYKTNFYYYQGEWAYRNIIPRFICERLILDENGQLPVDYKFFCFNGEPLYIQVDLDRFIDHKRVFFNPLWELQPFRLLYPSTSKDIPEPENLDVMLNIAQKLSSGHIFTRVDLYDIKGSVFFGEICFYPENGKGIFYPRNWDFILGEHINLPIES
jgi:hypothetical protein